MIQLLLFLSKRNKNTRHEEVSGFQKCVMDTNYIDV